MKHLTAADCPHFGFCPTGEDAPQCLALEAEDVVERLLPRGADAHKGSMGHALLVVGSYGMAGAAVLAARACLRSGAGKVTVHTPHRNNDIIQIAVPEAIVSHDIDGQHLTQALATDAHNAIGIGCGIGQHADTAAALHALLSSRLPIVIDADGLNILAANKEWLQQLPAGTILTPHVGEFERLAGRRFGGGSEATEADRQRAAGARLTAAVSMARRYKIHILLKGHHSALCLPNGRALLNTTGNAGMATAGSGDVLTGIITALLARGYKAEDACVIGMYAHGMAGDLAASDLGQEGLVASDIVTYLPLALRALYGEDRTKTT